MAEERLPLAELLEKVGDGDFLRTVAEAVLQLLMEADVDGLIGAGRYERTGERTTWRNGFRDRSLRYPARAIAVAHSEATAGELLPAVPGGPQGLGKGADGGDPGSLDQFQPMCAVDKAIKHGIGDGGISGRYVTKTLHRGSEMSYPGKERFKMNEESFRRAWFAARDEIGANAWEHLSSGQQARAVYAKMRSLYHESTKGLMYLNIAEQVYQGAVAEPQSTDYQVIRDCPQKGGRFFETDDPGVGRG